MASRRSALDRLLIRSNIRVISSPVLITRSCAGETCCKDGDWQVRACDVTVRTRVRMTHSFITKVSHRPNGAISPEPNQQLSKKSLAENFDRPAASTRSSPPQSARCPRAMIEYQDRLPHAPAVPRLARERTRACDPSKHLRGRNRDPRLSPTGHLPASRPESPEAASRTLQAPARSLPHRFDVRRAYRSLQGS